MNTASPSFRRTGSPSERARHEPSSTNMICSALGCRCSRCTLPGGTSEESKMIPRAPASSLLMTFLTIKPSWSGLVMTSAAASRTFLISTILLSQSVAYRHKNSMLRTGNLFDTIGQEGILERSRGGRSAHDEQHPTRHLAALDPRVGRPRLL